MGELPPAHLTAHHFGPLKNQLDNTTKILAKAKRKKKLFISGCHIGNNLRQQKKEQQTGEEVAKGAWMDYRRVDLNLK